MTHRPLKQVLRPRMLDSQGNFQIRCMACSSDGKLVITGGSLSCPGGDNTRNFVGALVPWRRSINRHDFGQWHCWAANQAEEHLLPPVTCLSLEGSCLVSGHASTGDVRKDDLSSPSPFHTTSMQAFRSFKPRSRWAVAGVICVWTIDRNTEDMVLCFKHTEGDGGDVTAVKILQARRHGLPLRMASVATSGTVTIWSGLDHENPNLIMLYSFPAHNDKVLPRNSLPRHCKSLPLPPPSSG